MSVNLTGRQLLEAAAIACPDAFELKPENECIKDQLETEITIQKFTARQIADCCAEKEVTPGYYANLTEYPEEGVMPL